MIDVKDATQTKGGTPVRVYATDGGGHYPVHGAIWKGSEGWVLSAWAKNGSDSSDSLFGGPKDLDLTDWRDHIPWHCLRDEIEWVARDMDGNWYGYNQRPRQRYSAWGVEGMGYWKLHGVKMPDGPVDWQEAIAQRPDSGKEDT